jgi:hypothetical protein
MGDTTAVYSYIDPVDRSRRAIELINAWRVAKVRGKLSLYFDGSGRVVRVTGEQDLK